MTVEEQNKDAAVETAENADANNDTRQLPPIPFWKKALLGVSLVLVLAGGTLYVVDFFSPQETESKSTMRAQSFGPHNFDSLNETAPPAQTSIPLNDWSAFLTKLGFSFFIGFSIGYALLAFTKLFFLGVGFVALLLFGFQYAGLIEVNWVGIEGYYNAFIAWLQPHIGSFKDLITTNLSSSGMAAAGLYTGFKR